MRKEEKKLFMAEKDAASASGCIKRETVCIIKRKSNSSSIFGPYPFRINMNGMEEYRKQYAKWEKYDIALMAATAAAAAIATLMLIISTLAFHYFQALAVALLNQLGIICSDLLSLQLNDLDGKHEVHAEYPIAFHPPQSGILNKMEDVCLDYDNIGNRYQTTLLLLFLVQPGNYFPSKVG